MVKLDVSLLRFLEDEDFRAILAIEMAMKNHDIAPTVLIERIAQLQHGGCRKRLNNLLKHKIIHHESIPYDGYTLKYMAYDFLALRVFSKRRTLRGVGTRIGCGKESDIMVVEDNDHNERVMKLQRLGRCSFRSVSRNRDYKGQQKKRRGESWFYLSRLAATKEYAFMKMLYEEGFPVPKPYDHNRHAIVMERIEGATLLNHINKVPDVAHSQKVYERCLALIVKLAEHGLIHGDFNEFNLFVTDEFKVIMIDFPQMVSTDHPNAADLFNRDVENLGIFFDRRFGLETKLYPKLTVDVSRAAALDQKLAASGAFTKYQQKELERLMKQAEEEDKDDSDSSDNDDSSDDDDEEEDQRKVAAAFRRMQEEDAAKAASNNDDVDGTEPRKPKLGAKPKMAKAVHFDPVDAPSSDEDDCHERSASDDESSSEEGDEKNSREAEDSSQEDGEDANSTDSEGDRIKVRKAKREAAATRLVVKKKNPNFNPDGSVNMDHVKDQMKQKSKRMDDKGFKRTMHANIAKSRDKVKMKRYVERGVQDAVLDGAW